MKPVGRDSSCAEEKYFKDGMQLPNLGRQGDFRRADLTHCGEGLPIPRGLASLGGVGIPMPNSGLTGLCHL